MVSSDSYDVIVAEYGDNINMHIQGIRASASLSKLGESGAEEFGLEPDNWLWFNRLINQSGLPGIGTVLLDKVLEYCQEKGYSIANQVSAYGDLSQRNLEDWYIRKGFTPIDADKYGKAFLKWVPVGLKKGDVVLGSTHRGRYNLISFRYGFEAGNVWEQSERLEDITGAAKDIFGLNEEELAQLIESQKVVLRPNEYSADYLQMITTPSEN